MNAPVNEEVIRKLQKMLAIANHPNTSEEEAAAAMGMAQMLMSKYNVDLQVVESTHVAGGTVEEKREKTPMPHSAMYQWQRDLWATIADANFCAHWTTEMVVPHKRKKKTVKAKRHVVLGRAVNVLATQIMGAYLCDTIEKLIPYPNSERMSSSAMSWRSGCAERLCERIRTKAEAMRAKDSAHDTPGNVASAGSAMVLRSVYEQEEAKNYDARWGEGQWAMQKQRLADWEAKAPEREAKRLAREAEEAEKRANETPAERKKREAEEAKDARANERWRESYYRKQAKASSKVDWDAYRQGKQAGDNIGIDKQVGAGKTNGRLV